MLARAKKLGFEVKVGFEYEFFVFAETAQSIRDKGYRNLKPVSPGFFGYSVLRNSVLSDWYKDLLAVGETMDMSIEGLHTETGAGVMEAALRVSGGLEAADKAALFKLFTKVLAQKRDWLATFMAKWSKDWPGCGGHMHMSLWKDGKPVFYDEKAPHRMSKTMRQFVAGQQALMPETLAMVASTVNAYRRLIPGFWAPTVATWGVENRTTALRVIPGSPKSTRVEYRVAAADANPYLALAAAVAAACGHRAEARSGRADHRQQLRKETSGQGTAAAHAHGGGGAAEGVEGIARSLRRRFRRSLFCNTRVGRA